MIDLDKIGDSVDRATAHPFALPIFTVYAVIGGLTVVDFANYSISYFTVALLFLTRGAGRRSDKALHIKLDCIIAALDKADDRVRGLEQRTEREIEEAR